MWCVAEHVKKNNNIYNIHERRQCQCVKHVYNEHVEIDQAWSSAWKRERFTSTCSGKTASYSGVIIIILTDLQLLLGLGLLPSVLASFEVTGNHLNNGKENTYCRIFLLKLEVGLGKRKVFGKSEPWHPIKQCFSCKGSSYQLWTRNLKFCFQLFWITPVIIWSCISLRVVSVCMAEILPYFKTVK